MKQILASVVSVNTIAQDIFEMKLYAPELFEGQAVRPGMFVHMLLGDEARILRRPISIYGANPKDGQIALAIQIVGQGTRKLSEKKPGDRVDILGPLGNSFEFQNARIIYGVGGGVGISPIRFAAMSLNPGQEMEALFGYRTQSLIYGDEGLECPVHITTDDGSAGEHGLVTAPLKRRMAERRPDLVICCGPTPMMRAVQKLCSEMEIECQLSLEARMGCGVGACNGCTVKVKDGADWQYRRVCVDGPVFQGKDVIFNG